MPRVPIHDIGSLGIIQDIPPHLLPPEAWSNGKNVRFQDNKVLKMTGHSLIFDPPTVAPNWAIATPTASEVFWLYTGLDDIYTVQETGVHTKITRASGVYTGVITDKWNGGVLGGIPVITNGVDDPQSWSPISASQVLVDLPNWPANTECKIIRSFKNFLVAMHITKSGTVSPHMVKWSHPADPGSVPVSWDETSATRDTGEKELDDSQAGIIQDAALLRDILTIYKDNSIWGMQHIGGRFIFRFFLMFTETGVLTQRCVKALPNAEQHLVMTGDDIVVHNGQTMESVINKKWKRFINNNLDPDNFANSFIVDNSIEDEMWFCFPEIGKTFASLALTIGVKTGTIGVRDLPADTTFIANGVIQEAAAGDTWDGDAGQWNDDTTIWGDRSFFPQSPGLFLVDSTNTKLFKLDATNQFNLVNMDSFVEREGLAVIGVDRQGRPKVDVTKRKLETRLWIKAEGGPFQVRVGSQQFVDGPITYEAAVTFTPGTDTYVDASANGPLIAVRFQSNADVAWQVHAYDIDIQVLGEI